MEQIWQITEIKKPCVKQTVVSKYNDYNYRILRLFYTYIICVECIRDEVKSWADSIPFLKKCAQITGNYDLISPIDQSEPLQWQCVDQDGIFFGDQVEDRYKCCLFGLLSNDALLRDCSREPQPVQEQCYDPSKSEAWNEGKIKPCSYWPT